MTGIFFRKADCYLELKVATFLPHQWRQASLEVVWDPDVVKNRAQHIFDMDQSIQTGSVTRTLRIPEILEFPLELATMALFIASHGMIDAEEWFEPYEAPFFRQGRVYAAVNSSLAQGNVILRDAHRKLSHLTRT